MVCGRKPSIYVIYVHSDNLLSVLFPVLLVGSVLGHNCLQGVTQHRGTAFNDLYHTAVTLRLLSGVIRGHPVATDG